MPKNQPKARKRAVVCLGSVVRKLARDLEIDPSDRDYCLKRLQQEGVPFLSKTLPLFAKFAIQCCALSRVLTPQESGFSHFSWRRGAPCFMQGLLYQAISGSGTALYKIRQFCEYFYKTAFGFTEEELANAQSRYEAVENEIGDFDAVRSERARKALHTLFPKLCNARPYDIFSRGPRDGPGAFARSGAIAELHGVSMEQFKKLPADVIGLCRANFAAFSGYFKSYPSSPERIRLVRDEGLTCEVLFVPKDSRGPRVISKEPFFLLKAQMAFNDEVSRLLNQESRGRINFRDQTCNQGLAESASKDRKHATLDLKEASDRVLYSRCLRQYRHAPALRWFLLNCRSTHARLPNGKRIRLKKLANMGSGMCFPILSLEVYLAGVLGVQDYYRCTLKEAALMVYVYGDDLIVPLCAYESVERSLTESGLLLNEEKSFVRGNFRESCGADFYNGVSVGPVRLRLAGAGLDPVSKYRNGYLPITSDGALLQLERHCRELVDNGLQHLADYYYRLLERRLGTLPVVDRKSPVLGRVGDARHVPAKGYISLPVQVLTIDACPYKGIGRSFRSLDGLGSDWSLTPLRRQLKLKRKVHEAATIAMYGLSV